MLLNKVLGLDEAIITVHIHSKRIATALSTTTTVLSFYYKSIISFPVVTKWAYVSLKREKKQIISNLNLVLFRCDSVILVKDKKRATGMDFIMCLDMREYVGSSEAEWNEEPGACVFKSQLSQAPPVLYEKLLERWELV